MDEPDGRDRNDIDRAAILARRRRFILTTLGGLTGVAGCGSEPPLPSRPPESFEERFDRIMGPEPVAFNESPVPFIEPPAQPPQPTMSDAQVRALLEDPALDLCTADPFAELDVEWTPEQHEEIVKARYLRAKRAQEDGDLECAIDLMEKAYFMVPGKHGFAFIVGELAAALGDCPKAWEYLTHFVTYADPSKFAERVQRATELLDTPELRACEPEPTESEREWGGPEVCLSIRSPDPPAPPPRPETDRERRQRERLERKQRREAKRSG